MVIIIPYNNFTQQPLDKIQAFFGIDTESEIYAVIGNILSYLSDLPEVDRVNHPPLKGRACRTEWFF